MQTLFSAAELQNADEVLHSSLLQNLIKKDARRLDILTEFFRASAIPYSVVSLKQHRHCIVRFEKKYYSSNMGIKTLMAHYDRAGNEFGVNDNTSACVQLAFFAKELLDKDKPHNIQLIFTDGEELDKKSITKQGAFLLGLGLRELNLHREQTVFVFDLCGSGDTLIFSDAGIFSRDAEKVRMLKSLQKRAMQYAAKASLPALVLPTAFSDNAGLLASGITAQLITVLPKAEAVQFQSVLQQLKKKLPAGKFTELVKTSVIESGGSEAFEKVKPATWKTMHTADDRFERLNVEAFALIRRYLEELAHD